MQETSMENFVFYINNNCKLQGQIPIHNSTDRKTTAA